MRQDRGIFLMAKYRIRNGIFQGIIATREKGYEIESISLYEPYKDKTENKSSAFEKVKEGQWQFLVKLSDDAYDLGNWQVLVTSNRGEFFVDFPVPQSEREFGNMISLSQTEVLPLERDYEQSLHLVPSVSKTGFFSLQKWMTGSDMVRKDATYLSSVREGEDSLIIGCKALSTMKIRQAEILLKKENSTELMRIPLDEEDVATGNISVDMSGFLAENDSVDIIGCKWQMFFHADIGGAYHVSPMEHFKNKSTALNEPQERLKTYDETNFHYGPFDSALTSQNDNASPVVWDVFYNRKGKLMITAMNRERYYYDQYKVRVSNLRIEQGKCTITLLCTESEFEFTDLILRSKCEPGDEDRVYRFERLSEKDTPEGRIMVWRRTLADVDFEKYEMDFLILAKREEFHYELHLANMQNPEKFTYPKLDNFFTNEKGWFVFPVINDEDNLVLYCRDKDEYDGRWYRFKEWVAECIFAITKKYFEKRKTTLFYENKCESAQDNAFLMFEYCMNHEELLKEDKKNLFYIMDKRQTDFEQLRKYKRQILPFMSIRHMVYLLAADNFVSTGRKSDAFHYKARPCQIVDRMKKAPFFFLQSGVTGMMKLSDDFKRGGDEEPKICMVSSEREKNLFMDELGYDENQLALTGLARWDILKDHSSGQRNVLMMPTWRSWLTDISEDSFARSEYCSKIREFIQSQMLAEILEAKSMTLTLLVHPKLKKYARNFEVHSERIQIFDYTSRPISEMLMMASMVVTDYSSIAWDAYYMGKPVIFYQFDKERYEEEVGSYMDLEKDLFGDIAATPKELFQAILTYEFNEFRERPENVMAKEKLLPLCDESNRERIFKELQPYLVDLNMG